MCIYKNIFCQIYFDCYYRKIDRCIANNRKIQLDLFIYVLGQKLGEYSALLSPYIQSSVIHCRLVREKK